MRKIVKRTQSYSLDLISFCFLILFTVMVALQLIIAIILNIVFVSYCDRRIKDGAEVTGTKRYVAYLVKAPMSSKAYDSWVCGGAIVSTLFIITSAACVDDVEYLYAVAGYKKYVTDKDIDTDQCTKTMKKKVIYTCVPMKYELNYYQLEKWSYIDIAVVKVESPFDFNDSQYESLCSYKPKVIGVNYEKRFQDPGVDGLVYGWGHLDIWRKPGDTKNYNQESLRYAAVKIIDKTLCKKAYSKFPNMSNVIDEFMICTEGKGEIDEHGNLDLNEGSSDTKLNGCKDSVDKLTLCDKDTAAANVFLEDETRREVLRSANQTSNQTTIVKNETLSSRRFSTRKTGICQNDHGGPLVTWAGANEVLIGVASVFKVTTESTCTGPYLYTSTRCNGMFLHCILSSKARRRSICDSPPIMRGYETVEKFVSWKNHPAGPAQNEIEIDDQEKAEEQKKIYREFAKINKFSDNQMIALRPQLPINKS
ncbi:uncharacterized protein LOC118270180 [Spodoptera frugiperda]|uniref:Uncharacterized protein LOC118270180 n=1 Tax=Spodoptera frugiperda TaxID=7108 RepID=A0A9R0DWP8_SPOFR|nr:uncharacterized protein LOC118270180 [Spodoptera frugiperda]